MLPLVDVGAFAPIMLVFCGVLMVVLRAGASRVFFDVVGTFQANKMLQDTEAAVTMMNAIAMDGLSGMEEAGSMVAEQMQKIVEATVPLSQELQKATLEFEKFVINTELSDEVRDVGLQFGFTAEQSLEAGARMAQLSSLIGEDAVPAATEMALAFGLIGDMSPESAMQKLINLQQQTGFVYGESTKEAYRMLDAEAKVLQVREEMANVLNTLNKVEDNSAATMSKITGVMNEFASQAHLAGESISMMAAMSATLIEAGEEQGKGGRALRMIYARLGADTGGAATTLEKLGVETKNADGSLRALSDVLGDLDPLWRQMNSGQKQFIAQQVAGNRHYVRFIKLAENHDRIMQLNQATTGKLGEVYNEALEPVEFLNDLMNSNAIALDKVNAELEVNAALIGDFFIPTTIAAKQFQLDFNNELLATIDALDKAGARALYLGDILSGFFEFQQIISSTFSPFFSAMINIKAVTIALMTQRQIMRALQGVALSKSAESKSQKKQEQIDNQIIIQTMEHQLRLTEEQRLKEMASAAEDKVNAEKKIGDIKEEIIGLTKLGLAVDDLRLAETQLGTLQRAKSNYNKQNDKAAAHRLKHGMVLKDGELIQNQASIGVYQRQGMYLEELAFAQDELNMAIEGEIQKRRRLIITVEGQVMVYEIVGGEIDETILKEHRLGFGVSKTDKAIEKQTMTIMKNSMAFMKFGMSVFIAEMFLMAFKDKIPGVRDEAHAARLAMILMGLGMAFMTAEMIYSTGAAMTNTVALGGVQNTGKMILPIIKAIAVAKGIETEAVVVNTWAWAALNSVLSWGGFIAVLAATVWALDKFLPKFDDMGGTVEDTTEAFKQFETGTVNFASDFNSEMDTLDWSVFDEGTESIEDFNNAREEMFFGFKAGNVTGDLIKQVQQGGVGSFIANTEIIMSNTFNGVSSDEVAEMIIDQLERQAGIHGMSTALA